MTQLGDISLNSSCALSATAAGSCRFLYADVETVGWVVRSLLGMQSLF